MSDHTCMFILKLVFLFLLKLAMYALYIDFVLYLSANMFIKTINIQLYINAGYSSETIVTMVDIFEQRKRVTLVWTQLSNIKLT